MLASISKTTSVLRKNLCFFWWEMIANVKKQILASTCSLDQTLISNKDYQLTYVAIFKKTI